MALRFLPSSEPFLQGKVTDTLTALATEMVVDNPPSATELPTYFEIEPDSETFKETVRITDVNANTCTIERGVYSSGVGKQHDPNSTYKQKITAVGWRAIIDAMQAGLLMVDSSFTIVRNSASAFQINGVDYTAYFSAGRLLRFNENDATISTVSSSTLTGGNTVVTLLEGSVPSPMNSIEIGIAPRGGTNKFAYPASVQNNTYGYAADSGSNDDYAVSLTPVPASYTTGLLVAFKANTVNTGASTLNVNGLGAKTIKKGFNLDLDDGDIKAGQIVLVEYDGTNFQMHSQTGNGGLTDGWIDVADAATMTFNLATTGKKLKFKCGALAGNRAFALSGLTSAVIGKVFMIRIPQDATGSRIPTWFDVCTDTISVTIANPAVITTTKDIKTGTPVIFTNAGGALPTGITAGITYYWIRTAATTGNIALTRAAAIAGTTITTSGTQSGVHTMAVKPIWAGGAAPTLTTSKYTYDDLGFIVDSLTQITGCVIAQDI
jgi:hypothetical protein